MRTPVVVPVLLISFRKERSVYDIYNHLLEEFIMLVVPCYSFC